MKAKFSGRIQYGVYITTIQAAEAAVKAMEALREEEMVSWLYRIEPNGEAA